ncbi:MAG TPA: GTP pyrophosphokinase family protein [Acholeplasmataceae bacterium]|nr:GTP pyrophosphokinase family protein [Acholeplasmataceae bacterium]
MLIDDFNWDVFLQPYELAINEFIIKLESMKKQYILKKAKNPIESITGRIKTPSSIIEKAKRLNVSFSDIPEAIQDIGGIRITCKYVEDVYEIYNLLQARKDIKIAYVKDYIKNPKPSGYRSLHIIAKHDVETIDGLKQIYIEFQIRTLAMHLWATIEHSLKYKYFQNIPEQIKAKLQDAAAITMDLDEKISKIHHEVETLNDTHSRHEYELEWEEHMIKRGSI